MSGRTMNSSRIEGKLRLSIILAAALSCASCQDIINTVFDIPAPGGVSASDGEYADRIEVRWSAPSLSGDKWEGYSVASYYLSWSGPHGGSSSTTSTSHTISVDPHDRAAYYDVTVSLTLRRPGGGTESAGSASDKGFAILTEPLVWADGGRGYTFSGGDQWYVTMLQQGFEYSLDFGGAETGLVRVFTYKTLTPVLEEITIGNGTKWRCHDSGEGGKFYVQVIPDSPGTSFFARYGW